MGFFLNEELRDLKPFFLHLGTESHSDFNSFIIPRSIKTCHNFFNFTFLPLSNLFTFYSPTSIRFMDSCIMDMDLELKKRVESKIQLEEAYSINFEDQTRFMTFHNRSSNIRGEEEKVR